MDGPAAEIRLPLRLEHLFRHALKLSLPDAGQIYPVGCAGGVLIEEYRHFGLLPDAPAHLLGKLYAFLLGDILHRHKGHHVHRAHPGMLSLVLGEVDEFRSLLCQGHGGVLHAFGTAQEGDNGAVVAGIGAVVQQGNSRRLPDLVHHRLDDVRPSPLADVGDALN